MKRYKPQTEHAISIFEASFCNHCYRRGSDDNRCQIFLSALAIEIDAPEYPAEIITDSGIPRCLSFETMRHQTDASGQQRLL